MRTTLLFVVLSLLVSATLALAAGSAAAPSTAPQKAAEKAPDYTMATAKDGETVFKTNCQACHMPTGEGAKGAGMYPSLVENPNVANPGYTAYTVMHGLRGMPAFSSDLSDEQIAQVANFLANHFGNQHKGEISVGEVKAFRPQKKVVYE